MITILLSIFNSFAFEFHCVILLFPPLWGMSYLMSSSDLTFIAWLLQSKQQLIKFQNSLLELYAKDSNFKLHVFMLIIYDTMQFEFRISNFKNFK